MKNKHIAIIAKGTGISFEYSAANTKAYYIAKIILDFGMDVIILSGAFHTENRPHRKFGKHQGIDFFMPTVCKNTSSKLVKLAHKVSHIISALLFVIYLRVRFDKIHYIFDDKTVPLGVLLLFERMGFLELIFNIEEWSLAHDLPKEKKKNAHFFAVAALKKCKKVICVSSFLLSKADSFNKLSRKYKLPAVSEFKLQESSNVNNDKIVFLYCGNVGFRDVIDTIIQAFSNLWKFHKEIELVLVLHGDEAVIRKIGDVLHSSKVPILIKTRLLESELQREYANATVLLAPLRNTIQDKARFPQKIAEYVSFAKPIITTSIGDIKTYFISNDSALLINHFNVSNVQEKMSYAINNREKLLAIGIAGNLVGRDYFDYRKYVASLGAFLMS